MSDYKLYDLSPKKKWSIFNTDIWHNTLKNGKYVEFRYKIKHRVGNFYISLTESKKNELLEQDKILIDDALCPKFSFHISGEVELGGKIINKQTYTEEEKKEIHRLLYFDKDDEKSYDPDCDCNVKDTVLLANGWRFEENDITYGISSGGCILRKMNFFYYSNEPFSQLFI